MELPAEVVDSLLHAASEAAVVTDGDGTIIFVNSEAETLFGYSADEMLGQPVEILIPREHREHHKRHRRAYKKSPRSRPLLSGLELWGCRKDGSRFRAEIALRPVATESGMLVASLVREVDTESRSEAYFRTMLESAPDAMVIVDDAGRIAVANGQVESMFGYPRGEMLGERVEMLLPERLRDTHREHRREFAKSPELRPMGQGLPLFGRRRDGSEFPVEISLSPVATSSGRFVASVIRDVTERKALEHDLIEARQTAERAQKANSAFLAAASHDLRQPVQALNLLNGALRRTVKDERALAMIESQEASLTAMTNLLNSLLDISRLDAGAVTPDVEDFPMQRLIDRLSAEFSRQARHKGLDFVAEPCTATVRSDPNLLGEIIQNLVSNAVRYTKSGSVRLGCEVSDDECVIEVSDTGIGIEDDQLEQIFVEFHQTKVPGARQEGFGLGLAIVRRLADLLGHEVGVRSQVGRGSTFSIRVPVVDSSRTASNWELVDVAGVESPHAGLVMLIEDDARVAEAWRVLLEAEGYRVAAAESATGAREIIGELDSAPALVISDFHLLDGVSGVDAVRGIRDHFDVNVPAFIVSGDTSKVVQEARSLDNCTIMRKPVNTMRLLAAAGVATRTGTVPPD